MKILRMFYSKTPKIKDKTGKVIPESITSLEKISLGALKQRILIRGENTKNPILLFLHGGPGSTEMPMSHKFDRDLEKRFICVHWDQRGAGKSFSMKTHKSSMNVQQFISDGIELVNKLKQRFNQEKIFLVGHSWGSVLGMNLIHNYPEHFHAYIGIGQVVNMIESEKISYEYVLKRAKQQNNKKAVKQLEKIKDKNVWNLRYSQIQRKWLTKFGGWYYKATNSWVILKYLFISPEYSIIDAIKFFIGVIFSLSNMWRRIIETVNFVDKIQEIKIPVYFIVGKHDYNTPFELVEKFYNNLKAPKKELIWFEESAHSPNYEEPEKYKDLLINKILPEILINE